MLCILLLLLSLHCLYTVLSNNNTWNACFFQIFYILKAVPRQKLWFLHPRLSHLRMAAKFGPISMPSVRCRIYCFAPSSTILLAKSMAVNSLVFPSVNCYLSILCIYSNYYAFFKSLHCLLNQIRIFNCRSSSITLLIPFEISFQLLLWTLFLLIELVS